TTSEVLTVAVLRQAQGLVIQRVDHEAVSGQAGSGLHLGQRTEDRVSVVGVVSRRFGLHANTVQQATQLRSSTIAVQELLLLEHDQIVKQTTIDLRHQERQIFRHLIVDLDATSDLGQRIVDLIVGVVQLRLQATFSNRL